MLALLLARGGLALLVWIRPANLPRLMEISIDPLVLAFLIGTSLLSAFLFGLIPTIKHARPRLAAVLGGGRTASRERQRAQNTLVVAQVALAVVLLVGAGLMIRSLQALLNVQPGFTRPEEIQILRISIPPAETPERVTRIQNDILDRIAALPGVASAAFATTVPLDEGQSRNPVAAENKDPNDRLPPLRVAKLVSPGLFRTQGTPLIAGRDFTWSDIYEMRSVAIVSESVAREIWSNSREALGKRIRIANVGEWQEIIGVVGNVYDEGLQQKASTTVYWRAGLRPGVAGAPPSVPRSVAFLIRSGRAGTENFLHEIRQAVWSVNSNLPLAQVRTLGEVYDRSMARTSFTLTMLAIAGSMALILGVVGIYGVMAHSVSQRKREIGIRLALGAQQKSLKRNFVRQGLLLTSVGVAIGIAAAVPLTRFMSSQLFRIQPLDPLTFAAVTLLLSIAAASASYIPARRASAVDPATTLRAE
jgi:predicted permease